MDDIDTHKLICGFGKHRGMLWTRVPVGYLFWIVNNPVFAEGITHVAQSELNRRGSILPAIEVSGRAIDRASLRFRHIWHRTALSQREGLHARLCRMAVQALKDGRKLASGKILYSQMKFAFEEGSEWPVLKSVM